MEDFHRYTYLFLLFLLFMNFIEELIGFFYFPFFSGVWLPLDIIEEKVLCILIDLYGQFS